MWPMTSNAHLPRGSVPSEVSKSVGEPGVDLIQRQLAFWRLHNSLTDQRSVRVRRSDVVGTVEVSGKKVQEVRRMMILTNRFLAISVAIG